MSLSKASFSVSWRPLEQGTLRHRLRRLRVFFFLFKEKKYMFLFSCCFGIAVFCWCFSFCLCVVVSLCWILIFWLNACSDFERVVFVWIVALLFSIGFNISFFGGFQHDFLVSNSKSALFVFC